MIKSNPEVQFYEDAKKFGKRTFNNPQDAEDFAGYCILHYLEGRRCKLTHLYTDFLRETKGDSRNKTAEQRKLLSNASIYDDELISNKPVPYSEFPSVDISQLSKIDRVIILLYCKWDLSLMEIAKLFDITESAVSYRITNMEQYVRRLRQ